MAKTKALISCAVTAHLICTLVFAYACCWFFNAEAHISMATEAFEAARKWFETVILASSLLLLNENLDYGKQKLKCFITMSSPYSTHSD